MGKIVIKTVTVIGANGTMGSNITGIFASFGGAKVYMISRTLDKSIAAIEKVVKSVKADSIRSKLIPGDFSMLERCVKDSDIVFESIAEDFKVKQEINQQLARLVTKNTIVCTGTSGLSVTHLSEIFPPEIRKNFLGMHFYNPPYSMTLCELIPTKYTSNKLLNDIHAYLTGVLYRTAVIVKDSPAFLGNRIGFYFINEALINSEKFKYNGGIDYIDAIFGQFSGRSMAPLITSDFVGLDVHKAIIDNIKNNTSDYTNSSFVSPEFFSQLIRNGKLGRKTRGGLYKQELREDGTKRYLVYDIDTKEYRDVIAYRFPFAEGMKKSLAVGDYRSAIDILVDNKSIEAEICLELLLKYVLYSLTVSIDVGFNVNAADDVMAMGFNWCPPMAVVDAFSGSDRFADLAKKRLSPEYLKKINFDSVIANIVPSKYDFRRYFKAK